MWSVASGLYPALADDLGSIEVGAASVGDSGRVVHRR